jgi:hypothetical protein
MSRSHEREGNHVDTNLDKGVEETKVFWCRRRYTKPVGRDMNTWSTGEMSAVIDSNTEMISLSSE